MAKLTFLFKSGRKERLESKNEFPTEFFYGYVQLVSKGITCAIIDERDLGLINISFINRTFANVGWRLFGLPLAAIFRLILLGRRRRIEPSNAIIATTTTFGLSLATLMALGLIRSRIVFIAMGLLKEEVPRFHIWVYRRLLRHVVVATLSRADQAFLQKLLGPDVRVSYLQFGVDHRFWAPETDSIASVEDRNNDPFILSIGNDSHRDYSTLIAAWQLSFPKLKIVTQLPVPLGPDNVEIVRGDWRAQILSDGEVRALFRRAKFIVLPIRQTFQPSGQSACLQAMACGKTVIMSDIYGLWDRELMVSNESCVLVPPESSLALRECIKGLLDSPEVLKRIGSQARRVVERYLNVDNMAKNLLRLTESTDDFS
jgi:glycosyltransferase involved in cell wall biosynthesis